MPITWIMERLKKRYGINELQHELSIQRKELQDWAEELFNKEVKLKEWGKQVAEQKQKLEDQSPIKNLLELDDDPNKVYVWIMKDREPDHACWEFMSFINSEYIKNFGRDPKSLHIVVKDIDEIKTMGDHEFRSHIKFWFEASNR